MPLDFPSSPTIGQQYLNWTWNGVAWVVVPGPPLASLAQSAQNAGRNYLDNALFNINQRGGGPFNITAASGGQSFTTDRWLSACQIDTYNVSVVNLTDSDRAAIGDEAALYGLQHNFTGSTTAGSYSFFRQAVETPYRLSGKQITVSAWMKASSGAPRIGFGYQQNFGSGGSPSAPVSGNLGISPVLSASWQRVSFAGTLPSAAGKIFGTTAGSAFTSIEFWLSDQGSFATRSGGIGAQAGIVEFWGLQVEVGSQATPLEKLVPEVDLARCQRFYQLAVGYAGGYAGAPTTIIISSLLPVVMRTTPTLVNTITSDTNLNSPEEGAGNNFIFFQGVTATANAGWILNRTCTASADL